MSKMNKKTKFIIEDFYDGVDFAELEQHGLKGYDTSYVQIIDYHDRPGDNYQQPGIVCQVKSCKNEKNYPLKIILFDEQIIDYEQFIGQTLTASAGNFYYPGWESLPSYEVRNLRVVGGDGDE